MKTEMYEYGGAWRPTPQQELLLRAALWQGDAARVAWEQWRAEVRLPQLDVGSQRLLPLLYQNQRALAIAHPEMPLFKQVYQQHWLKGQLLMRQGVRALQALTAANIPTLLLKAAALIPLYYQDPALRPTTDIDVVVPTARAREALYVLHEIGWQTVNQPLAEMKNEYLTRHYAHTLKNASRVSIDLHRHVLSIETRVDGDAEFWAGAQPLDFYGIATHALNPADQLLHTCAHGTGWNPVPPIRWVADAYMILARAQVDWSRLLRQAVAHELVTCLRHTLPYLRDALHAQIPDAALDELRRLPVSRMDEVQYELWVRPQSQHNTLLKLWYHYIKFQSLQNVYQNENWFLRFPAFLRDTWDLAETREVPAYMLRFATNWLARRATPFTNSLSKDRA